MKGLTFRQTVLNVLTGAICSLLLTFSMSFVTKTGADEFCPDTPNCQGGYCFTRSDGVKKCKYYNSPSGCNTTCQTAGGGGGPEPPHEGY